LSGTTTGMLRILRHLTAFIEFMVVVPRRAVRLLMHAIAFNPKLGPLRHVVTFSVAYVLFALVLVYVVAPIRGVVPPRPDSDAGASASGSKFHFFKL